MGVVYHYVRLLESELRTVVENEQAGRRLEERLVYSDTFEQVGRGPAFPEASLADVDKAWDGIRFVLDGEPFVYSGPSRTDKLGGHTVHGVHEAPYEWPRGHMIWIGYSHADEVRTLALHLEQIDFDGALLEAERTISSSQEGGWDKPWVNTAPYVWYGEYLRHWYGELAAFYHGAAKRGEGVIVYQS